MAKQIKKKTAEKIIELLNSKFINYVPVQFERDEFNDAFISKGTKNAINKFKDFPSEVKATFWFDTYWYYISIKILRNSDIFTSISFFQEVTENELKQLFRADWDNYSLALEYNHPQPHWHFTAQLSDMNFKDLEKENDAGIFDQLAGNAKSINLDRMHFAMAGNWIDDGTMATEHTLDESKLVNWLINLFMHVRKELEYKDLKTKL